MDTSRNNNATAEKTPGRPVLKDLNAIEASGKSLKRNSLSSSSSTPTSGNTPKVSSQAGAIVAAEAANQSSGSPSTEYIAGSAALPDIISNAQHIKENHNESLSGFLDRFNTLAVNSPAGKVDSRLLTVPSYAGHHNSSHTSSDDETFVECDSYADESALLRDTEDFGSILNATELLEDTRIITPAVSAESLGELSDSLSYGNVAPAEATFVASDDIVPNAQTSLDATRTEPNCSTESVGQLSVSVAVNGQSVNGSAEATFVADADINAEQLEDTRILTPDVSAESESLVHGPAEGTFVADVDTCEESAHQEPAVMFNESANDESAPIASPQQPDDSPVANGHALLNDSGVEENNMSEQPIVKPVFVVDAHIVGIPIDRVIVVDAVEPDMERAAVSNDLDRTIDTAVTNLPLVDSTFHFGPAVDQTINVTESVDETCVLDQTTERFSSDRTMVMDETVNVASPRPSMPIPAADQTINVTELVDETCALDQTVNVSSSPPKQSRLSLNREDAMVVLNPFAHESRALFADEVTVVDAATNETTSERVSENVEHMDFDNFDVSMNELPPAVEPDTVFRFIREEASYYHDDDDDAMDVEQEYEEETEQEITQEEDEASPQVVEPEEEEAQDNQSDDGFDLPAPVSEPPPFVRPSPLSDAAAMPPPPAQNIFRELSANQKFDADAEDDEQFQGNNSVLQSADFDFLLACGQTTPNNNPARTPTTADQLPPICRDSVLLRFDPLLGRQEQLVATAVAKAATAEKSMQNNSGDDNDEYGLNGSLPLNSDDHANRNRAAAAVQFADAEAGATGLDDDDDTEGATFAVAAAAAATVSTTAQQAAQHSSAIVNAGDAKMSVGLIEDIKMEADSKPSFVSSNNPLEEKTDTVVAVRGERNTKSLKVDDVEKKLKEAELREEAHIRRIAEKDRDIAKISGVMDSYEQAIAELVAEKAELIHKYTQQNADLQQDRDENFKHLTCLESTFSDLHSKYERSKQITLQLKEQEDTLLKEKARYVELLKAQEQRYDKMKQHAIAQLEIANSNLDQMTKSHKNEMAMLRLNLKREEITKQSTLDQLMQKTKENEELIKICDELISSQGS